MKLLSMIPLAISLLIFAAACTTTDATPDGQVAAMAAATDPCYMSKNMTNATQQACISIICAHLALTGVSCHSDTPPSPPPQPSAMGGSSSVPVATGGSLSGTGGHAATGGTKATGGGSGLSPLTKCIAAKKADPNVKNVAAQNGQSVSALAAGICADPIVLGGFQ